MITDRLGAQLEMTDLHGGRGPALGYIYFGGEISPSINFFHLSFEPGCLVGYHVHETHEEIIYVLSGTLEAFEDGTRRTLVAGDAILAKPGKAHAFRTVGDEPVSVLGFAAKPAEEPPSVTNLPLPEALSDW